MNSNVFVLAVSTLLAGSCFVVPRLVGGATHRLTTGLVIVAIFLLVFLMLWRFDSLTLAMASLILGGVLAGVAEALKTHFNMVHAANDPKHRRCY